LGILIARDLQPVLEELEDALQPLRDELEELAGCLLLQPVSPESVCEFERALRERLREAGRRLTEVVYNRLEPDDPDEMPKQVERQGYAYSRKNGKTRNRQGVATLFGRIELSRYSYEPLREARDDGERSFSPLERMLGLVAGNATPALAERVGRAAGNHTQQELRNLLQQEHCVKWSVKTLRKVTAAVSAGVAEHLHQAQKEQLLAWLRQADGSKGRGKITLAVGRDGIMLPIRHERSYKEGAVATLSVHDRRGRRLGTVYLGQMPEAHQSTLSTQLTRLVSDVLEEWDGCWPRLAYITDAGHHPSEYFESVLSCMPHPRHPGRVMEWVRIVDYYHACQYIARLAELLFRDPRAAHAWQRRMRRWLKDEPNAVYRILHSAAKLRSDRPLRGKAAREYQKAYNYLRNQKPFMDYREYRRLGLPIGSGVTEAACKTVFTQRFKESGMSWGSEGGQTILTLRVATLSGVWDDVYRRHLAQRPLYEVTTQLNEPVRTCAKAT
jgi:hypothetical protein